MIREKDEYYLKLAETISAASTCIWCRCGVVIVDKEGQVISTGYSHGQNGIVNCRRDGCCSWQQTHGRLPQLGTQSECNATHAEIYAICNAERSRLQGATLYVFGYDCVAKKAKTIIPDPVVSKMIMASGISDIRSIQGDEYQVLRNYYETFITDGDVQKLIKHATEI